MAGGFVLFRRKVDDVVEPMLARGFRSFPEGKHEHMRAHDALNPPSSDVDGNVEQPLRVGKFGRFVDEITGVGNGHDAPTPARGDSVASDNDVSRPAFRLTQINSAAQLSHAEP